MALRVQHTEEGRAATLRIIFITAVLYAGIIFVGFTVGKAGSGIVWVMMGATLAATVKLTYLSVVNFKAVNVDIEYNQQDKTLTIPVTRNINRVYTIWEFKSLTLTYKENEIVASFNFNETNVEGRQPVVVKCKKDQQDSLIALQRIISPFEESGRVELW